MQGETENFSPRRERNGRNPVNPIAQYRSTFRYKALIKPNLTSTNNFVINSYTLTLIQHEKHYSIIEHGKTHFSHIRYMTQIIQFQIVLLGLWPFWAVPISIVLNLYYGACEFMLYKNSIQVIVLYNLVTKPSYEFIKPLVWQYECIKKIGCTLSVLCKRHDCVYDNRQLTHYCNNCLNRIFLFR